MGGWFCRARTAIATGQAHIVFVVHARQTAHLESNARLAPSARLARRQRVWGRHTVWPAEAGGPLFGASLRVRVTHGLDHRQLPTLLLRSQAETRPQSTRSPRASARRTRCRSTTPLAPAPATAHRRDGTRPAGARRKSPRPCACPRGGSRRASPSCCCPSRTIEDASEFSDSSSMPDPRRLWNFQGRTSEGSNTSTCTDSSAPRGVVSIVLSFIAAMPTLDLA